LKCCPFTHLLLELPLHQRAPWQLKYKPVSEIGCYVTFASVREKTKLLHIAMKANLRLRRLTTGVRAPDGCSCWRCVPQWSLKSTEFIQQESASTFMRHKKHPHNELRASIPQHNAQTLQVPARSTEHSFGRHSGECYNHFWTKRRQQSLKGVSLLFYL
jgi:hypothetical protein